MRPLNVGLLGFGTVGKGVFDVLARNGGEIARRAGRPIRITWIGTRTLDRAREATRGATLRMISRPFRLVTGRRPSHSTTRARNVNEKT